MAVTWGAYKSVGGPVNFRAGLDVTYSPAVVTSATTSVTVTTRVYLGASGTAFASGGSWSVTGSDSGSASGVSWNISGAGSDLLATLTETVALTYGASKSFSVATTIRPSGSWPGSVSHVRAVTIPARPVEAPVAPSSVTVARVSDSRQNLAWTSNTSTARPYSKQEVWRRVDGGDWGMLASLTGGAATSYADTSTAGNRRYEYQIRAWNAGGGAYSGVASIVTTPATPGAPSAAKNSSGDIVVTRPALSPVASTWAVGEFGASTLATGIPASQSTWTHPSPSAVKTWRYVILASSTGPTLNSAWSSPSNTVQLQAPPLAPTSLAPSGAWDAVEAVTFSWSHNPVDTTPQSAYEFQWRQQASGGEPVNPWESTGKVASGASARTVPAGTWTNPGAIEWQVRTWGNHADPGAWSSTALLRLSGRPVAGTDMPAAHDSSRLVFPWTYFDPEGSAQSAWEVVLLDAGGQTVTSRAGSGAAGSVQLTGLDDNATYTARVRVRDGALLWSAWAEHTFTVTYALPPVPSGTAQWHKDEGYVTFTVDVPNPTAEEELADHLQLWRATSEGWVLVADDLAAGEAVVDMTPPTGLATYRVAAVSALPSTAWSSDIVVETRTKWVFFNYGPGFGRVVRLYGNLSVSRSAGRSKVLHQLAGRAYPVERSGDALSRTYNVQGALFAPWLPPDLTSTWVDFEDLAFASAPVLVRDPEGARLFCSVGDVDLSDGSAPLRRVSVPLTVVDWPEEAVAL